MFSPALSREAEARYLDVLAFRQELKRFGRGGPSRPDLCESCCLPRGGSVGSSHASLLAERVKGSSLPGKN